MQVIKKKGFRQRPSDTAQLYNSKPDCVSLSQNGSWLRQQTTWQWPPSPVWLSGSPFDRHLPWMLALPESNSLPMLLQDHLSTGPTAVAQILSSSISSGFQLELHLIWKLVFRLGRNRTLSAAPTPSEGKWKHIRMWISSTVWKPTFTQQITTQQARLPIYWITCRTFMVHLCCSFRLQYKKQILTVLCLFLWYSCPSLLYIFWKCFKNHVYSLPKLNSWIVMAFLQKT